MEAVSSPEPRKRSRQPVARAGFDIARLEREIAAAGQAHEGDEAGFRAAAVELFRAALDHGRDDARKSLENGGTGRACAERLSDIEDQIIRALLHIATRRLYPELAPSARVTILAVGGYGRGMLAPGSDIDLLFLLSDPADAGAKKIIETILYVLWDLKQKVGHATRSIDECLKQARSDLTISDVAAGRPISGRRSFALRTALPALRQGNRRQDHQRVCRRQTFRARRAH